MEHGKRYENNPIVRDVSGVAAQRLPAVVSAIDSLDYAVGHLHERLTSLQDKLTPVLGLAQPVGVEGTNEATSQAPLADRIHTLARGVLDATQRIDALNKRLEV